MVDRCAAVHDEAHARLAASAVERVGRMRLVGSHDLHRPGLVEAETPLGDVEVVCAPVAVVAGAVVVVEAPEHRVELVYATRRALVGVGRPWRRPEPHVPIDVLVWRGLRGDVLDCPLRVVPLAEEAVRVGGAAEIVVELGDVGVVLRGGVAVVAIDELDVADQAVADDHRGCAEFAAGALPGAGLENGLRLALRLDDFQRLFDAVGEGLFAIDILAGLHRLDGHVGVPVVGRDDDDHVDGLVGDDLAEVGFRLADAGELGAVRLVPIVRLLGAGLAAGLVAVADRRHDWFLLEELREHHRARLDAHADNRDALRRRRSFLCSFSHSSIP